MPRLTQLHGNEAIPCSRCDRSAHILLFNGDIVASASQLMFFCKNDLSRFLRDHPRLFDELIGEVGLEELHLMLD